MLDLIFFFFSGTIVKSWVIPNALTLFEIKYKKLEYSINCKQIVW